MKVSFLQNGALTRLLTMRRSVRRLLEQHLTYKKFRLLYGAERWEYGGRRTLEEPIECFDYIHDPDGVFSRQLIFPTGYLPRIRELLRSLGHDVHVQSAHRERDVFAPHWDKLRHVEWRWKQKRTLKQMCLNPFGRIHAPTGFGKGFIFNLLGKLWPKARIDFTTYSVDVLRQIHNNLSADYPLVGLVTGSKKRPGTRLTCYSADSLHHADGLADVLVADEIHEFSTPARLERLGRYQYARKFGFSANFDDRTDGSDFELEGVFGPRIVHVTYQEGVIHGAIVPIEIHWEDVVMDVNPCDGLADVPKERHGIWRNRTRNRVIAEVAHRYPANEQVLVLVKTIDHAMYLKRELPEFKLVYAAGGLEPDDYDWYVSKGFISCSNEPPMTDERRENLKAAFERGKLKKVIANSVWNRGVDFRRLGVEIRADAASTAIANTQLPGRTSRLCGELGKEVGIVHDFLDQFDEGYRRKALKRRADYTKHGWKQVMPERGGSRQRALFT